MFQPIDVLVTKPFNDLSAVVSSVGNIVAENSISNYTHLESKVVFKNIEATDRFTRTIMFTGSIIEVVDSTTTRIYTINLDCVLIYNNASSSTPFFIRVQFLAKVNNEYTPLLKFLPYTPVLNSYSYTYDFFAIIGFTYGNSTIKATLRLAKSFSEGIVNGSSLVPVEFYLVTPARGNLSFQESLYNITKNPNGLTEVAQLVGVLVIPSAGDYTVVLDLTRVFATSTDLQAKSINSQVSINKLNTSKKLLVEISTQEFGYDSSTNFYFTTFSANVLNTIPIVGSFVVPAIRSWDSKPRDLTFNYQT